METTIPAVSAPVDPKFLVAYRRHFRLDKELGECNCKDEKADREARATWRKKLGHADYSPETARVIAKREEANRAIADRWGSDILEVYFDSGLIDPDSEEFVKGWADFKAKSGTPEDWAGSPTVRPAHRPVSEFTNEGWIKSRLTDVYELDMSEFLAECETVGIKKENARVYVNRLGFRPSKVFVRAKPIPRPSDFPGDTAQ